MGFALSHNEFIKLEEGEYEVFIDSEIKPGKLVYSDTLIKGKSKKSTTFHISLSSTNC